MMEWQVVIRNREAYCGNAGDSRAVLCRQGAPVPLSNDHKPSHPTEAARVRAAGGEVPRPSAPPTPNGLALAVPPYDGRSHRERVVHAVGSTNRSRSCGDA